MRLRADDPGLASERTALAWQRTGVVLLTLGALTLTASVHRGTVELGGPLGLLLAGFGTLVARRGRASYLARRRDERYAADEGGVVLVVTVTIAAALLAAVMTVVGW